MKTTDLSGLVGTTNRRLAVANPRRIWLGFRNLSANNIYISMEAPASATKALNLIDPSGYFELTPLVPWKGELYIIASLAGSAFLCQEVSED